jgi:hypothetical protein
MPNTLANPPAPPVKWFGFLSISSLFGSRLSALRLSGLQTQNDDTTADEKNEAE